GRDTAAQAIIDYAGARNAIDAFAGYKPLTPEAVIAARPDVVLITEQGAKAVELGVRQSRDAGEAIRQLTESIGDSAVAASQIAVSAHQQLAGMDQLALAMENIRVSTTQNMASTRQAESAAHDLHALGQKLQAMVGRYRV
ncbi:MAG: hypothetical protein V4641_23825, partial [Pseudomonadota bacterium]